MQSSRATIQTKARTFQELRTAFLFYHDRELCFQKVSNLENSRPKHQ